MDGHGTSLSPFVQGKKNSFNVLQLTSVRSCAVPCAAEEMPAMAQPRRQPVRTDTG
jgi:hypothetical protein